MSERHCGRDGDFGIPALLVAASGEGRRRYGERTRPCLIVVMHQRTISGRIVSEHWAILDNADPDGSFRKFFEEWAEIPLPVRKRNLAAGLIWNRPGLAVRRRWHRYGYRDWCVDVERPLRTDRFVGALLSGSIPVLLAGNVALGLGAWSRSGVLGSVGKIPVAAICRAYQDGALSGFRDLTEATRIGFGTMFVDLTHSAAERAQALHNLGREIIERPPADLTVYSPPENLFRHHTEIQCATSASATTSTKSSTPTSGLPD